MDGADKILKDSSKYKLYNKFNDYADQNEYIRHCRKYKYMDQKYKGFTNICHIFAKNLIKLPEVLSDVTDKDERCIYFNFWITDYVRKMLGTQWEDKGKESHVLTRFLQVENSISVESLNNNCHFDYVSGVNLELWKEWKDLHDYIKNYDYINERINSHGAFCTLYSKYFVYIKALHEKYKKECCQNPTDKCPNRINLGYFCTSDRFNNKLKCDENKGLRAASTEEKRHQPIYQPQEDDGSHLATSESNDQHDTEGDRITNNTDYYTKLGFTSFGTWIRSKVLKEKINVDLDEDSQNLIENELNEMGENLYNDGYNITYHPS
ncbi:PIR Superfamily Protein [Plasmodium ovale curtisi]|uniref:PIR Superfamily Protein n=1 Tax=Plasmodium ovale curtisi TaxID=864141 RepID=A0A1A8X755_PLAOA|nr:PIR Superfamily Protein [Plasmodium ovale curtisi]